MEPTLGKGSLVQRDKRETHTYMINCILQMHEVNLVEIFKTWFWNNWVVICQKWLNKSHVPYTKTNLKWIIDLKVRWKTIKLLEEDMKGSFWKSWVKQRFLRRDTKCMIHKEKIDNLNFINILNFKGPSRSWKCKPQTEIKYNKSTFLVKGWHPEYIKNSENLKIIKPQ